MVDFNASEAQLSTCLLTKSSMGWLWHRRLGHVGMKQLNKLIKHDLVRGLKDVTFEKDKLCSACQARKQVGNTHPKKSMMSTSKAFELMHIDLFGPTTYTSIGGNKYRFVIVDDFTRYTWVFIDVLPLIAYHGGARGSMFGLRHMQNSMVNTRDS